jgi:hypothetical protein
MPSTGDGAAVVLQIPPGNLPFLRFIFTAGRDGAREDLDRFGTQLPRPERRLREEATYGRLLDAIEGMRFRPDAELVEFLAGLAEAIDRDNEYSRVTGEHDAINGVLTQAEGALA